MNIEKIYSCKKYQIPVVFESNDIKKETNEFLTSYIRTLKNEGVSEDILNRIKKFRKSCAYMFSNYLKGMRTNAFLNFEKALSALAIEDSPLMTYIINDDVLYRARINTESKDFSNEMMSHIPLDKRSKVATQRYSFPGLPCLYCGASAYTCWLELGRPSFEKFQVSTLKNKKTANVNRVIDLSYIPQRIDELKERGIYDKSEYLLYWVLLAMCSIRVKHENDPFKPEYIFPQFLLEHILTRKNKNEIIGIKYVSVKVADVSSKQYGDDWHTYVNYVFPTHSDSMSKKACSSITNNFEIIHNKSGQDLAILTRIIEINSAKIKEKNEDYIHNDVDRFREELKSRRIYTKDGRKYSYVLSIFGSIELVLYLDSFDELKEDIDEMEELTEADIEDMFDKR